MTLNASHDKGSDAKYGKLQGFASRFASGAIGGMTSGLFLQPFETVKTRLIVFAKTSSSSSSSSLPSAGMSGSPAAAAAGQSRPHYTGVLDVVRQMTRNEGILSLWKVCVYVCVCVCVCVCVFATEMTAFTVRMI
jgi:Mitochondrial carrier protein